MRKIEDILKINFTVHHDRPPNYDMIFKALPAAAGRGVIFTYGADVYNPSGNPLDPSILAHEAVHVLQQTVDMTPDEWWKTYIQNPAFRAAEELEAHQVEMAMLRHLGYTRLFRRRAAKHIAQRLAGPLYGKSMTYVQALKAIKEADHDQ